MKKKPIVKSEDYEEMRNYWDHLQEENDERMAMPWVDIGRAVIAIGWTLLCFGMGVFWAAWFV